ncbi:MurR/RpiR family transcriptional regulator [Spiroplasma endosymbiont of Crioceris asparagi]|uniref:MurR/RpiR family transcriptional regulator n=1 Tax=Spiroplasma endosymbiont of Crioceris asparagi TaxID=3066286 RepID=UPI0030D37F61
MIKKYDLINKIHVISVDKNHKHNYIANKILNDKKVNEFNNIEAMAKYLNTSPSTLSRFAKEIGLDSYKNIHLLVEEIWDEKTSQLDINLTNDPTSVTTIANLYYETIAMTEKILNGSFKDVENICFSILNAKKIVFFAVGGTYLICLDLSNKLNRLGFNTIALNDFNNVYYHLKNLEKNDILFLISYSGKTAEVIKTAKECKNSQQAKIIAITNKKPNLLTDLADINLKVESLDPLIRNSSIFSRISIFLASDVIYNYLLEIDNNYFKSKLETTKIIK